MDGLNSTCNPIECCEGNINETIFNSPCIDSPVGYNADFYIYAMTSSNTYSFTIPIAVNSKDSNESTIHQAHVARHHKSAFHMQRQFIHLV